MVLARGADGSLRIIEEFTATQAESNCNKDATGTRDALIENTIAIMSDILPMEADEETRLDSLSSPEPGVLVYTFTLINETRDAFTKQEVEMLTEYMSIQIFEQVCGLPNFKPFVASEVTIVFTYLGKNGDHITTVSIKPGDCGK